MFDKIFVIIPSLDPNNRLNLLIDDLRKIGFPNVIVVDDGTIDKHIFNDLHKKKYCNILTHAINQGKGRALKTAINHVLVNHPDCIGIVTADSDGQHTANDIKKVALSLENNPDSLILGSRDFSGQKIPFRSKFGNLLTLKIFNFFSGITVHDTQTGLRGIPRSYIRRLLNVEGEGFEFEMNMLMECKSNNIPVKEEFIQTIYIEGNKSSHFNKLTDSVKIYFVFLKFILSSMLTAVIDFIVFYMSTSLGAKLGIAMIIARFIASITNFTINKTSVFNSHNKVSFEILKYYGLVALSGMVSFNLIKLFSLIFPSINIMSSKIIAETILFILNFYIQSRFVFNSKQKEE